MDRENYTFLKGEYDKQIAEFKARLEEKYALERNEQEKKIEGDKTKTERNFKMSEDTYGVSEKDKKNVQDALAHKEQTKKWFLEQEKQKELQDFEKVLEKEMWKDFGGSRMKAREDAFGPDDPAVKAHNEKLQKQKEQQQALEASRQQEKETNAKVDREQIRQNIRGPFRDNAGKTR